jgi:hypothetical protein
LLGLNFPHFVQQKFSSLVGFGNIGVRLEGVRLPEKLYRYQMFQSDYAPDPSPRQLS